MKGWIFENPRRLYTTAAVTGVVCAVLLIAVLGYRVHQLSGLTDRVTQPQATEPLATGQPLEQVTSEALPSIDPYATTTPDVPLKGNPTYPKAGDPLPVALDAVNAWLGADYEHLEGLCQPAAYEDLSASPVPEGTQVDGTGSTTLSGPTASEVRVPTNNDKGDLLVTLVTQDDDWKVTSFGWSGARE